MTERIIRPNRHSSPSLHGSKVWPKKTATPKIWPRPKKIVEPVVPEVPPVEPTVS